MSADVGPKGPLGRPLDRRPVGALGSLWTGAPWAPWAPGRLGRPMDGRRVGPLGPLGPLGGPWTGAPWAPWAPGPLGRPMDGRPEAHWAALGPKSIAMGRRQIRTPARKSTFGHFWVQINEKRLGFRPRDRHGETGPEFCAGSRFFHTRNPRTQIHAASPHAPIKRHYKQATQR